MSTNIEGDDDNQRQQNARWIERALVFYLGLPILLFLSQWLNFGAAFFNLALLFIATYCIWHVNFASDAQHLKKRSAQI